MVNSLYKLILNKIYNNIIILCLLKNINRTKTRIKKNTNIILIVFSKDRPFQLRSFLLSALKNLIGISKIIVIYKSSDKNILYRYQSLILFFQSKPIQFVEEKSYFKIVLNKIISKTNSSHIMFSVDDILIFDQIIISNFKDLIKENSIFSLRLGKNINYSYILDKDQGLPKEHKKHKNNILSWKVKDGKNDFGYPFSLDMNVFPSGVIKKLTKYLIFSNVNSYEGALNKVTKYIPNWDIFSFSFSKCVNLPLNKVQIENNNKFAGQDSSDLLEDFDKNKYFDFNMLNSSNVNSPHQVFNLNKIDIKKNPNLNIQKL
jgi:hypothetical protein